ncbi:MAG: hypothetical protein QUS08_00090 [Methanothrix sp.]|nr:hypothetical protein [Methanothrix sp.]
MAKAFLIVLVLLIFAADTIDAGLPTPGSNIIQPGKYKLASPQLFGPSISINAIYPALSAAGNSNRVGVDVSVYQLGNPVCGLNGTNFKLDTLNVPPYGPEVVIHSVGASGAPIGQPAPPCSYIINLVPATYLGKQYTWVAGTYTVRLDYVKGGKELTNKTFNFTIH